MDLKEALQLIPILISHENFKKRFAKNLTYHQIISKFTCRFHTTTNPPRYDALEVCDDKDVQIMISAFQENAFTTRIEFYVDKDQVGSSSTPVGTTNWLGNSTTPHNSVFLV